MKTMLLALSVIFGFSFVASAQDRARISATVETTTSQVVTSASKSTTPGIEFIPTRWVTSEQLMTVQAQPTTKFTALVRFNIAGGAENPPVSVDPKSGVEYRAQDLRGYASKTRRIEVRGSYRVWRDVSVIVGYMRFSLAGAYDSLIPYDLPGGGLVTTYGEKQTYSGFEFGAHSAHRFGKLTLAPELLLFPHVSRNFRSHQNYLGHVFDNDIDMNHGNRLGMQLSGRATYTLMRYVGVTFAYTQQMIRTTNSVEFGGPAKESLKTRTAMVGLQVGF